MQRALARGTLDAIERVLSARRVAAVVVSVNHTNPLGAVVPDAAKRALVQLCTSHRVPIIEDDAYGELGFTDERPPALKAFDTDGWVMTCGTLSKTLSPGLRVGWVAAGRFDGFWEFGLKPWDMAAGIIIVREAGGFVSDLGGGDRMMASGNILAANDQLHAPLLKLLRAADPGA